MMDEVAKAFLGESFQPMYPVCGIAFTRLRVNVRCVYFTGGLFFPRHLVLSRLHRVCLSSGLSRRWRRRGVALC